MPKKSDYERGMEIPKRGQEVDGWTVRKVKTSEEVVERYKRYKFVTYVEIEGKGRGSKSGLDALRRRVRKRATVLSPYGNAYICITTLRYRNSDNRKVMIEGDCRRD
jgi:hypothetical protein